MILNITFECINQINNQQLCDIEFCKQKAIQSYGRACFDQIKEKFHISVKEGLDSKYFPIQNEELDEKFRSIEKDIDLMFDEELYEIINNKQDYQQYRAELFKNKKDELFQLQAQNDKLQYELAEKYLSEIYEANSVKPNETIDNLAIQIKQIQILDHINIFNENCSGNQKFKLFLQTFPNYIFEQFNKWQEQIIQSYQNDKIESENKISAQEKMINLLKEQLQQKERQNDRIEMEKDLLQREMQRQQEEFEKELNRKKIDLKSQEDKTKTQEQKKLKKKKEKKTLENNISQLKQDIKQFQTQIKLKEKDNSKLEDKIRTNDAYKEYINKKNQNQNQDVGTGILTETIQEFSKLTSKYEDLLTQPPRNSNLDRQSIMSDLQIEQEINDLRNSKIKQKEEITEDVKKIKNLYKENIIQEIKLKKQELNNLEQEKNFFEKQYKEYKDYKEKYEVSKQELENIQVERKKLEIIQAQHQTTLEVKMEQLDIFKKKIEEQQSYNENNEQKLALLKTQNADITQRCEEYRNLLQQVVKHVKGQQNTLISCVSSMNEEEKDKVKALIKVLGVRF